MARNLSHQTDGGTVTAEQAREHEPARSASTNRTRGVLTAIGKDAINITIAVSILIAIYWLLGQEFPGGTFGISALLGGLIVLDAVATAYDCLSR